MAEQRVPFIPPGLIPQKAAEAVTSNAGGLLDAILDVVGTVRIVRQRGDGTWPTITRRPWLDYMWWATVDQSKIPKAANGARAGDLYPGATVGVLPDPLP